MSTTVMINPDEVRMELGKFALVPEEVWLDDRLTYRQFRVLVALFSFRGKNTNVVFPSRKALADRCRLPETRISVITGELQLLGWLTKEGKGGFSKATRYTITVPDFVAEFNQSTVTESVTVTEPVTVTKTVTPTVTKPVTLTVTELVTRKEHTNEHTKEHIKNRDTAAAKRQPTRLADDWELPDEWAIWAKQNRPDLNPNQVADIFKDYWIAVAGVKGKKQDWFATWRNWCRNQKQAEKQSWADKQREWVAQATGKARAYEPDIFDIAMQDARRIK